MPPARQCVGAVTGAQFLGDREPDAGRDLLRAQEIFMRGVFERAAFERHQTLIAVHVAALIDGHRQMAATEQFAARCLAVRNRLGDAGLVEARAGADAAAGHVIDHQHAHRPVALRLHDEAAVEFQRRAEQGCERDRLAEQLRRPAAG